MYLGGLSAPRARPPSLHPFPAPAMPRRFALLGAAALIALAGLALWPAPDEAEKTEPGAMEPTDWFFRQRAFPHGAIDAAAVRDANRQSEALRREAARRGGAAWAFAGPTNVGGRVTSLAVESAERFYVGTGSGGVFKTTDGGASFTPVGDDVLSLSIGDVALDPSDPQRLYVGTGEVNGGGGSITYGGQGVFRSPDGGQTWAALGLEETSTIGRVVVHPTNPAVLWVAAAGQLYASDPHRGVYRTADGGQTWAKTLFVNDSTGVVDLAVNPRSPDTLYAAAWERRRRPDARRYGGPGSGVYRSTDGGLTWSELTNGLPGDANVGRIGIAVAASRPNVVYAVYSDASGDPRGTYRSDDGGDTWTARTPVGNSPYEWWFGQVRVDPTDPDRVYYGSLSLYTSSNGGGSWQNINGIMHVDHHALWADPTDPSRLIAGNDGGVYHSVNRGASWTKATGGFPATQFYTTEIDASAPERLYGGTQDNGTNRTVTGALDDWEYIYGGDGFIVQVDPSDNQYVYAESQYGGFARSTNGGISFLYGLGGVSGSDRKNWKMPYLLDPHEPSTLYLGTQRVYRSTDRAGIWAPISPDLTDGPGNGNLVFHTLTALDVSPADRDVIWAGSDDGNVHVTTNGGADWTDVSAGLPKRWVTGVAAHPTQPLTAYVTLSGYRWGEPIAHVLRTDDGGQTWEPREGGLPPAPANVIRFDPDRPERLFLGTDAGAFYTEDTGLSWALLGPGLPAAPVLDLDLHPPTQQLVAATYGRGMYRFDLSQLPTAADPPPSAVGLALSASPNPARGSVSLRFTLPAPGPARLAVYDVQGRRVAVLADGERGAGGHAVRWEPGALPAGAYLVRLDAGGRSATVQVQRVR